MPKHRKPSRRRAKAPPRSDNVDRIALLVAEIEDALGAAEAFGQALELMGLGLRNLEGDYSGALVAVTATVLGHIDGAKQACSGILAELSA
jgi:hypothetical protein